MFYTVLVLTLLAGIVVGINFNVVMLGNLVFLSILAWGMASLGSSMSFGSTLLSILLTAVALQVGYFIGLIIVSMGLKTDEAGHPHVRAQPSRLRRLLMFGRRV